MFDLTLDFGFQEDFNQKYQYENLEKERKISLKQARDSITVIH